MSGSKASRVEEYLDHILAALSRIRRYTTGIDKATFDADTLIQDAVIRNIETIGEAANRILTADPTMAANHPQLRLDLAYRMRNALIHGYDSVNLTTIWNTINSDLPELQRQIESL